MSGWKSYYLPSSIDEATRLLKKMGAQARLVAGGTDLLVEYRRGKVQAPVLIDITRIPELLTIHLDDGYLYLGAAVTHARLANSAAVQHAAPLLAQAAWQIGSPQVRNRGTLGGNLGTASPSGDLLPPLVALEAQVQVAGPSGRRWLLLEDFILGVKQINLGDSELICGVRVRPLNSNQGSIFLKYGVRRGRSIAVASAAVILTIDDDLIRSARVSLGAVTPRVRRFPEVEQALSNQRADQINWADVETLAAQTCSPISDLRGSADYRRHLARTLVGRAARLACQPGGSEQALRIARDGVPPFILGRERAESKKLSACGMKPLESVHCRLNGQETILPTAAGMTLLQALRQGATLSGTKEGCAEGECGACTVILNNQAVLACLTPAAAAHDGELRTIESATNGQSESQTLVAVQQALIEAGAVQCGYCTPGLVMAATALVESQAWEKVENHDLRNLIREGLSGNLCRCTGYSSIVDGVEKVLEETINSSQEVEQ